MLESRPSRGRSFGHGDRYRGSGGSGYRGRGRGFRSRGSMRGGFGRPRRPYLGRSRGRGRRSPLRGPRPGMRSRSSSPAGDWYGDSGKRSPQRRDYSPPRGRPNYSGPGGQRGSPSPQKERFGSMSRDRFGDSDRFSANGMNRGNDTRYGRDDSPPPPRVERRDSRPGLVNTSMTSSWKDRSRSPQASAPPRYRSRSPIQRNRSPQPFGSRGRRGRPLDHGFGSSNDRSRSPPMYGSRGGGDRPDHQSYGMDRDRMPSSYGSSRGRGRLSPPSGPSYSSRGPGGRSSSPPYGSSRGRGGRSSPPPYSSRGRGGRSPSSHYSSRGHESSPPMYNSRGRGGYSSFRGRGGGRSSPPPYGASRGSRRSPSPSFRGGRGRGGRGRGRDSIGDYSSSRSKDFGSRGGPSDYPPPERSYGSPGSSPEYSAPKPRSYSSSGRERSGQASERREGSRERGQFRAMSRDGPSSSGRSDFRDYGSSSNSASYDNYRGQRDQRPVSSSRGRY